MLPDSYAIGNSQTKGLNSPPGYDRKGPKPHGKTVTENSKLPGHKNANIQHPQKMARPCYTMRSSKTGCAQQKETYSARANEIRPRSMDCHFVKAGTMRSMRRTENNIPEKVGKNVQENQLPSFKDQVRDCSNSDKDRPEPTSGTVASSS